MKIVMTGGTSGIGLVAANALLEAGAEIVVGARHPSSSADGRQPVTMPLDLMVLNSVRRFAAEVEEWLGDDCIDALVLNAGMQVRDIERRTPDGFEVTFAVNHLAHYLLLRLLTPKLAKGARVVLTTSNLHDPATNPVAPPLQADAAKLAAGQVGLDPNGHDSMAVMRAYAASKLCNLLTVRAVAASDLAGTCGLRAIAFNPGFTPGTGLTRNHPPALRLILRIIGAFRGIFRPTNTVQDGGSILANLAMGRITPPAGRLYASQVERKLTWPDASALASDDAVMAKLWNDSAEMVGLLPDAGAVVTPTRPSHAAT